MGPGRNGRTRRERERQPGRHPPWRHCHRHQHRNRRRAHDGLERERRLQLPRPSPRQLHGQDRVDQLPLRRFTRTSCCRSIRPRSWMPCWRSAAITETVTVTEQRRSSTRPTPVSATTMTQQTIERLPVEGRNVVHLLSLQPGAVFIPTQNANTVDPRYGAVAGSRADQQNVTLDGIDVNDPQLQAAYTSAVRMTQEALQEFKVSTSNYGAEAGRSSGAAGVARDEERNERLQRIRLLVPAAHRDVEQRILPQAGAAPGRASRARRRSSTRTFSAARLAARSAGTGCSSSATTRSSRRTANHRSCGRFRPTRSVTACCSIDAPSRPPCPGGSSAASAIRHTIAGRAGSACRRPRLPRSIRSASGRASRHRSTSSSIRRRTSRDSTARTSWTYRFAAPIKNDFNTFIGRLDYRDQRQPEPVRPSEPAGRHDQRGAAVPGPGAEQPEPVQELRLRHRL